MINMRSIFNKINISVYGVIFPRVEAGKTISTVALRVVEGGEKRTGCLGV
jgi:hypothetical protein